MAEFMPGVELGRLFYEEAIRPLLDEAFPGLPHSAVLLGRGSEVLGFDTQMSADHKWGPRGMLFLREDDLARHHDALNELLRQRLPRRFRGYSTELALPEPPEEAKGNSHADDACAGPVHHWVDLFSLRGFFLDYLGFDLDGEIEPADWLTFPEQKLRALTAGAVYHDEVGLQAVRDRFAWYPHDVWLYLLAAGWQRIGPEQNLVGRAGSVGDELGSALIGARLVRDLMRLCFLMEKQYAPYSKWFGTAFGRLACAPDMAPILWRVLRAETWHERERALTAAYGQAAAMHHALHITEPVPTERFRQHKRPFEVLWGDFPGALRARIHDPAVKRLAERGAPGSIEQISDDPVILLDTRRRGPLRRLYK
jgi:Domain of unknown function (DUF4037)